MSPLRIFLVAVVAAATPWAANAQCVIPTTVTTADRAAAELSELGVADCLGGTKCSAPNCVQFAAWRDPFKPADAVEILTAVRNSAASSAATENTRRLVRRIDDWIAIVGEDAVISSEPGRWRYEDGGGGLFLGTPDEIKVDSTLEAQCAVSRRACSAAFTEAVEIITAATLVERVNGRMTATARVAIVTYVRALDKRWEHYFSKSPSQFPWELLINGARYRKQERRGFNEPPSSQLIVLHPSAAFAYATSGNNRLASAIVLEAIGYFARGLGGSIGPVWTEGASDKVGYAVMAHWRNKVTLGAAFGGGSSGPHLLLGANAEKFLTGNAKRVREALTKVR